MDLRERVVAAVDRGTSRAQVAADFGVSLSTVERCLARRRATGALTPSVPGHGRSPVEDASSVWLPARWEAAADATLAEHAAAFAEQEGVVVSGATVRRAITALPPPEQDGQDLTSTGRRPGRPLEQRP